MARRNKNIIESGRGMRRGQTIVAERERMISDSERMLIRKKTKRKKIISGLLIIAGVGVVGTFVVVIWINIYQAFNKPVEVVEKRYVPTVTVEDAGNSGLVTARMKEYVGMIEGDFRDSGQKVVRAVVPAGKTREIDIYLDGRSEYYKTYLDRGTGETVEDVLRMMKYLDKNGINPEYVDVRVRGKAYYK